MIAQDTGSAIVGPARADIFFGGGDAAGARAGAIRHRGAFTVLCPSETSREGRRRRPMRLRRLSDEEIALWTEVAKQRLAPPRREPADARRSRVPAATAARRRRPRRRRPRPKRRPAKPAGPPPLAPIERRLKRELARGRGAIDGALDLHGMNQAEAHQALRGFLRHAQAQGARLVIVVTGKGGPLGETRMVSDEEPACCAASLPTGCASPTCARSCSASRRRAAPTAARARSVRAASGGAPEAVGGGASAATREWTGVDDSR